MTPEQLNKIATYRQKCQDGTITIEEMKDAIVMLRESRTSAAQASRAGSRKASSAKPVRSADDILAGLGDL